MVITPDLLEGPVLSHGLFASEQLSIGRYKLREQLFIQAFGWGCAEPQSQGCKSSRHYQERSVLRKDLLFFPSDTKPWAAVSCSLSLA